MSPAEERGARRRLLAWLDQRVNLTELFSLLSHFGVLYAPMDTSRPLAEAMRDLGSRPLPDVMRWPRVLGPLAALLFGLEAVTGVLLAYYYRPVPEAAFESTRTIVRDLPFGWLLHQMHAWGAWLLVVVVVLRLLRLFWHGLYRAPRELLWFAAVAMVWLVLQADFTGRLLTWDSHAYWAAVRGMEVVFALPLAGPVLAFLLGGRVINEVVLIRFYVLHLVVLPILLLATLYLAAATLRRTGPAPSETDRTTTLRDHLFSMTTWGLLLFGGLVTLAALFPFHFGQAADPYRTPAGTRPPWYMLAPYALLQGAPGPAWLWGTLLLLGAFAVLLIPLWLRVGEAARGRLRAWGALALAAWLALSLAGLRLDPS
jgi:quinol-cytochrome oxidoreductase complex cytochrome b subunit